EAVDQCQRPALLVAHSLGTALVTRWAQQADTRRVAGAFLVAPTDTDRFAGLPETAFQGFEPVPMHPLPFPSCVVASRNDERVSTERARAFAAAWGSRFIDAGPLGHIGSAARLGLWPQGLVWLGQFLATLPGQA
ncbi:MAG: alpha/beta hydrolase, partial [Betaproteobacteria bacterium]|nr:alpha/beta hydrolase [Betaproteobacteria bacterium]